MANNYEQNRNSNLGSHEAFDTFFMSKEEVEKTKRKCEEKGLPKEFKKFFIGAALYVPLCGLSGFIATMLISNPVISNLVMGGVPLLGGIWGLKTFFSLRKGAREVKQEIREEDSVRKK